MRILASCSIATMLKPRLERGSQHHTPGRRCARQAAPTARSSAIRDARARADGMGLRLQVRRGRRVAGAGRARATRRGQSDNETEARSRRWCRRRRAGGEDRAAVSLDDRLDDRQARARSRARRCRWRTPLCRSDRRRAEGVRRRSHRQSTTPPVAPAVRSASARSSIRPPLGVWRSAFATRLSIA